jgi:hypothetical protein
MTTIQDLQDAVLAYPEVEVRHYGKNFVRLLAFKTNGKNFVGIDKDTTHATFALAEDEVKALIAEFPSTIESISKSGKLIGVRVDVPEMTLPQLQKIVELSWRHVVPKRRVASNENTTG